MWKVPLVAGEYYHLYNRGVNRQPIFFRDENWVFVLQRMQHYFRSDLIHIVAYCLMPNHYHLLAYPKCDDVPVRVLHPFSVSYAKAINRQLGRSGPLFEGRFKAKRVDKNQYLLHLSRYIHLNPVLEGLAGRPEEWASSSYREYAGLRRGRLAHPQIVLSQFPSPQAYAEFVASYCEPDKKLIKHPTFD